MGSKLEDALKATIPHGETVLRVCHIVFLSAVIREGLIALTDRRVLTLTAGIRGMGAPRLQDEIDVDHIKDVSYFQGGFMDGPNRYVLTIESRTGTFAVKFQHKEAQREGPHWPAAILDAQRLARATPTGVPASDISAALGRLADLHKSGALTAAEFAEAKRRLLA